MKFWRLVLIFTLIPIIELLLIGFMTVMNVFGMVILLVFIVATGILGAALVRRQGLRCWSELNRQLDRGETPTVTAVNGVLILIAALCIIAPGLLSDFVGFLLLVPLVRALVVSHLLLRFESYRLQTGHVKSRSPEDVIDID